MSQQKTSRFQHGKETKSLPLMIALRRIKIGVLAAALSVYSLFMFSASAAKWGAQAASEQQSVQAVQTTKLTKEEAEKLFTEKLQPILDQKCAGCHGASATSGLDLRTREAMLKGGTRGPAVVPGDAAKSWLYISIKGDHDLKMPMGKPLAADIVDEFRQWIEAGAPIADKSAEKKADTT